MKGIAAGSRSYRVWDLFLEEHHPGATISSFSFPDITEFALRKSIVRALKIFRGTNASERAFGHPFLS
ncbi:MAG: hypothetical protein L0213_09815, partial [Candidatus Dadabacteria bacterium]|nr:hypothetical protein [Candidatus Dadabacteria bacterium]